MLYEAAVTRAVSLSIVLVLLAPVGLHCAVVDYYVVAANGALCPDNVTCQNLSYYTSQVMHPASDTIFYFLLGIHALNGTLNFENFSNQSVTLQGIVEQGAVMQSSPVLKCGANKGSLEFVNGGSVYVHDIIIQSCGKSIEPDPEPGQYQVFTSLLIMNILSNVSLHHLSVEEGTGFGLIVKNCPDVFITFSNFTHNGHKENVPYTYSGGNAYIAYDSNFPMQQTLARVQVSKSTFSNGCNQGSADIGGSGLSIVYNASNTHNLQVTLLQVNLSHNIGKSGTNLFILLQRSLKTFSVIATGLVSTSSNLIPHSYTSSVCITGEVTRDLFIQIKNSSFLGCGPDCTSHSYEQGVVIQVLTKSTCHSCGQIVFDHCTIAKFSASGLTVYSIVTVSPASIIIQNTIFDRNVVPDDYDYYSAILLVSCHDVSFDNVTIAGNSGSGIECKDSVITFKGNVMVKNNSAHNGGGIALLGDSLLILDCSARIFFINNTAHDTGGAIYVDDFNSMQQNSPSLTHNCFYQLANSSNLSMYTPITFTGNKAGTTGSVLYGGNVTYCMPTFSYLFKYDTTDPYAISSDPIQICLCNGEEPVCNATLQRAIAYLYPGESFNITIAAIGQQSGFSTGEFYTNETFPSPVYIPYTEDHLPVNCTNMTLVLYAYSDGPYNVTFFLCFYTIYEVSGNFSHCTADSALVAINSLHCPCGFTFTLSSHVCQCDPDLLLAAQSHDIICDINTQEFSVTDELWTGYDDTLDCYFAFTKCPFDYCSNSSEGFILSKPSSLCDWNRTGVLCGHCRANYSLVLGSNECEECVNTDLTLILAFAFAGVCLIALITALNLTVSVGTINGLIFYANIIKLYGFKFFSKCPLPLLSQFIAWLNFDLGIKTCFYDGMHGCAKTWLQFAFPAYIWSLIILIILFSRYSTRLQKLVGSHAVSVLATLLLLSYQKIIQNVILALYYVQLDCYTSNDSFPNRSSSVRWLVDADITYLTDCHLPLFIFALLAMVFLIVPYTCLLLLFPLVEGPLRTKSRIIQSFAFKMKPFFDAYGGPYKDTFRFWTGFLILVRVFLALLVSFSSDELLELDILTSILLGLVFLHWLAGSIYRHRYLSMLEVIFLLDLVFLAYLSAVENDQDNTDLCLPDKENDQRKTGGIIMIVIAFVLFMVIVAFHIHKQIVGKLLALLRRYKLSHHRKSCAKDDKLLEQMLPVASTSITITDMTYPSSSSDLHRESLLFDPDTD